MMESVSIGKWLTDSRRPSLNEDLNILVGTSLKQKACTDKRSWVYNFYHGLGCSCHHGDVWEVQGRILCNGLVGANLVEHGEFALDGHERCVTGQLLIWSENEVDQNTQAFKEVAIIRHPRIGEYAFGFITSSVILQTYSGEEELYSVYVPTNHLYIGDIFLVNSKDVIRPNLSVREGIEIVVSGGMSMPQILSTLDTSVNVERPRNNRS
ncbi:COV 1-like protein [Tanacetum coccineum]